MLAFTLMKHKFTQFICFLLLLAACTPTPETPPMIISLAVDGRLRSYEHRDPITVSEFLRLPNVDVELGDLDVVIPPAFTQLYDQIRITVSRVREESACEEQIVPFRRETIVFDYLKPGETEQGTRGQDGKAQICYRIRIVDGVERERIQSGDPVIIEEPINEVIFVGPTTTLDPVDVKGTIAYVNLGNAWVISGSSDQRRPITITSDLDTSRAFSLSPDGRQLLYARAPNATEGFSNELWLIQDVGQIEPVPFKLTPENILFADWVPGRPNTISYSRAEPRTANPGYSAQNDLWLMAIDPQSGTMIRTDQLIEGGTGTGGPFSWWGTRFDWSPDGQQLAWVHANAVGTVNLSTGELNPPLFEYEYVDAIIDWSWRTTVSWSLDTNILTTTVHGPPAGSERPDRSVVFNVALAALDGTFEANLVERAGIWSVPQFSPKLADGGQFAKGYLAYLRAREPLNSGSSEYDLFIADQDGSNARHLFPDASRAGLTSPANAFSPQYTWSPDGTQIVVVYQGNLWIVDVETGTARQLTLGGTASYPVWGS